MLSGKRIVLIITGGIAAYKALELIRRLRERGAAVHCILTEAATRFVSPLSAAALSEQPASTDLFSLTAESEMGHIRLAREADMVVVAPATANTLAKMAAGLADNLATSVLLATDRPVLVAPAMNTYMWRHPATQENLTRLRGRGIQVVGPAEGDLACGETGPGRMVEPPVILEAIVSLLAGSRLLEGMRALVTSGPTREPIDPVRFIGNRSSGKQGLAIAAALAAAGARTTLVSGPTGLPGPAGVEVVQVETALQMLAACQRALPVEVAVCAAAVADWRPLEAAGAKIKKGSGAPPALKLVENPDILATLASPGPNRPRCVVGFAAETEDVIANAREKLCRKGCDLLLANDVSPASGVFGSDTNSVHLVTRDRVESWQTMSKAEIARRLVATIAALLTINEQPR